ncbi:MAG TPA: SRPBCC family protein [Acidimicrobiia bacterium]|nr:SRPBCC family protein [Acidimicrobiia bacterium]
MSLNQTTVDAPPQVVWELLAEPPTYQEWVVGNQAVRDHDRNWPAAGTEFHHTIGFGPVTVKDRTVAVESEPARRLVMNVRFWPVGHGLVTFGLEPAGAAGTRVVMDERPLGGPVRVLWLACAPLVRLRNAETLRRLKRCAEARHRGAARER